MALFYARGRGFRRTPREPYELMDFAKKNLISVPVESLSDVRVN